MKRSVFRQVWWFRFPPDSSLRLAPIFSIPPRFSVCGISMSGRPTRSFVAFVPGTRIRALPVFTSRIIFKRRTRRQGEGNLIPERTREIRGDQLSRTGKSERVINGAKGNAYVEIRRKRKFSKAKCYTILYIEFDDIWGPLK